MQKVGREGVVFIEESKTGETYLETVEGMQIDRGYKSPYFVTDNSNMSCILNDALVLIADKKFTQVKELLPILEAVSAQNKSLLIVAEDVEGEALATLIVNKMRGTIKACAIKAPDFGDRRKLILEDLATLTGGQVFSTDKGMKLDKFSWDWFGEARVVTITKEETTIVDGKGSEEKINGRIEELQLQIEKTQSPYEREKLQERLAKLVGGVAVIHVGGNTEVELKEKKDRVDDALNATKAAIEEGIVPGGGAALLHAREVLENQEIGSCIVFEACGKPFEIILKNAGYTNTDIYYFKNKISDLGSNENDVWLGMNVKTEQIINMKEAGIIDPAKVTRCALENAASIAGTILLTEVAIVEEPEEKKTPNNEFGDLGGMY
jgi:chaperonin GroEL